MNELNRRIELEALITEREGMESVNDFCRWSGTEPAYTFLDFGELAERIRALAEPEPNPHYTPEDVQRLVEAGRKVYGFLNARGLAMGIHNALAPFKEKK